MTHVTYRQGGSVIDVLDLGTEGPGFKSQSRRCRATVLYRQTVHTRRASVHQAAELAAGLLRVAIVTAGLAENDSSLPPRVYDSRYLQARTGIRSGTLLSVIEYGLPTPFRRITNWLVHVLA